MEGPFLSFALLLSCTVVKMNDDKGDTGMWLSVQYLFLQDVHDRSRRITDFLQISTVSKFACL